MTRFSDDLFGGNNWCCNGPVSDNTSLAVWERCEDLCGLSRYPESDPYRLCSARCPAGTTPYNRYDFGGSCCQGTVVNDECSTHSTCVLDEFAAKQNNLLLCPKDDCPVGSSLYGLTPTGGGFCCNDTVSSDFLHCSTTNICALDPDQSQGYPVCPKEDCPVGSTPYGMGAGAFCCNGTVSGDHWGCNTHSVCATSGASDLQGYPRCGDDDCTSNLTPYGLDDGGFCCNGSPDSTNQVCLGSSACALDPNKRAGLAMCLEALPCPGSWYGYGDNLCCSGPESTGGGCSTGTFCAADPDDARRLHYPLCGGELKGRIALQSMATNKYLTAANYGQNVLTPFANTIGTWELFDVMWNKNGSISLRSTINNMLVSTHGNYSSRLAADRTTITNSESFFVEENPDGTISLMALGIGQYIAVEPAYTNNLVADEGTRNQKTKFRVWPQ